MYEILYIVPANYTENELKGVTAKIETSLKEQGVVTLEQKSVNKLKFAYPIEKNTVGYYILVEFNADGEALKKINRAMQLERDVLRFMITKKRAGSKDVKLSEFIEVDPSVKKTERKKEYTRKSSVEKDKIKLEDIEEKLDTLLEKEIV